MTVREFTIKLMYDEDMHTLQVEDIHDEFNEQINISTNGMIYDFKGAEDMEILRWWVDTINKKIVLYVES